MHIYHKIYELIKEKQAIAFFERKAWTKHKYTEK